jgi:glucose/arabinose dehydrogenase
MKRPILVTFVLLLVCGLLLPGDARAFANLPPNFVDEPVVGSVPAPTAIDWLPSGDLLVTSQQGILYQVIGGAAQPVLDLSGVTCSDSEMGLLGLAVDPAFQSGDRFVYLYYTHREGNSCNDASSRANRVSRFSVDGSGAFGNEQVLIDHIRALGGNHNAGDLQFDKQNLLYVSVGDSGKDLQSGVAGDGNGNARRFDLLNGKILRIHRDGGIPGSNPFQGAQTTRCAASGRAQDAGHQATAQKKHGKHHKRHGHHHKHKHRKHKKHEKRKNAGSGAICQEIFATGLRNPFRFAFDPEASGNAQRFFINDVGGGAWEEVDDGQAGADYGWNIREGPCPTGTMTNCSPSGSFTEPIYAYSHDTGCVTITGGAFVPDSSNWPAFLDNTYLFADMACGLLFARDNSSATVTTFGSGTGAVDLKFGGDGSLYYTTYEGGGQVRRIRFTG